MLLRGWIKQAFSDSTYKEYLSHANRKAELVMLHHGFPSEITAVQ